MIRHIAFTLFLLVVVSNVFEADALPAEENVSKQLKGYIVDPLKKVAEKAFVEVIRVGVGAAHLGKKVVKKLVGDDLSSRRGRNMVLSS